MFTSSPNSFLSITIAYAVSVQSAGATLTLVTDSRNQFPNRISDTRSARKFFFAASHCNAENRNVIGSPPAHLSSGPSASWQKPQLTDVSTEAAAARSLPAGQCEQPALLAVVLKNLSAKTVHDLISPAIPARTRQFIRACHSILIRANCPLAFRQSDVISFLEQPTNQTALDVV